MPTGKELSIALAKALSSTVPIAGPFIAEGIAVLESDKIIADLENRIEFLEAALSDLGFAQHGGSPVFKRRSFHTTHDSQKVMNEFNKSLSTEEAFESYIKKLVEAPSPEFVYFCPGVKIMIVHDIMREMEETSIDPTRDARDFLYSFAASVLTDVSVEDDTVLRATKGPVDSPEEERAEFGYLGNAWHSLGWHLLNDRQYHDAIRCFIKAVETGCEPMVPLLNIANAFSGLGYPDYAIRRYTVLIERYKYSLQVRHRLAGKLTSVGRHTEAAEHYAIFIEQFDERVSEGCTFPKSSHQNRKVAGEFLEKFPENANEETSSR